MRSTTLSLIATALILSTSAHAQTLTQALALAYRSNPTLLGEQANHRAVTENSSQSRAGWRPTVTVNMDANYQQGPYTNAFALGTYTSNYAEGYVTAKQTIYSFGHVANQVRAADARSRAEGHALSLTESQVFTNAITAYMDVLRDRNVLEVRRADLDMLARQVELTTSRYTLGGQPSEQVTRTDVEQAETRRRSAEVALTQARATLAASEALFRAVIGVEPQNLAMPDELPGIPSNVQQAVQTAIAANPGLAQMRETKDATTADIDTARSQWGPQIQVQGTFGTIGPGSPFRGREYSEQVAGTVSLVQPIYNGDLYNSQIRQARAKDEQARQNVELAKRTAFQKVVTNWQAVKNGLEAVKAGMAEVQSGETTLKGYQLEYGYGLRSTTDVLYADQNLRTAQVELASSRHDTIVAEATLLAAMGRLQASDLLPNERHYDANAKFQHARTRGWEPLQAPISAIDKAGW
ncbi:TolC family outer membrane protein [Gluconobacter wancherniae]|uniref:TolC family outer membrane protein n=1 Tax=Gluconobacter wancherniae TaxID=1307955 RepID=UPI00309FBFB0